jgi:RNA-binding protein
MRAFFFLPRRSNWAKEQYCKVALSYSGLNIVAPPLTLERKTMAKQKQKKVLLNKKQVLFLRGLAQTITPLVMIGQNGISPTVLDEIAYALDHNELIKVKVQATSSLDRKEVGEALVKHTNAGQVQIIGKMIVLYRPSLDIHKDKKISLP